MNYAAVPNLRNQGSVCYLNSCIQAISACPLFTKSINTLYNSNKDLYKLKDFNNLLKSMDDSGYINIATNNIFNEWNKHGQQDSFDLLAYVINQVYDEIRKDMERRDVIEKRSLDQWLTVKLPLKIKMQYSITCKCGFNEKSPFQSEIALHLSFPKCDNGGVTNFIKSLVNNYKRLHIDDLLSTHFEKEAICDFKCGSKFCKSTDGWRNLKLSLPLPDTICIHLQRNLWIGTRIHKINDDVLFNDIIKIKKEYLNASNVKEKKIKEEYGNKGDGNVGHDQTDVDREVHYYLKSVIVHHGEESFGHYICYKKLKGRWFYTSDTTVYPVNDQNVFSCNPYILFYEKEDEVQMSPTIIKVDENLNIFINAISSCVSFINCLNKMSDNNDYIIIKRLLYLTNVANGSVRKNEELEKDILTNWGNQSNTYVTMTSIFKDIGMNNRENSAEEYICGFISSRKICCDCGFYTSSPSEFQCSLKVAGKISVIYSDIQALVDERMKEEKIIGNSCNLKDCTRENGMQKLYFRTTPRILCIEIESSMCSRFSLLEKLIIKKEYFITTSTRDKRYELRSVITESGRCCYRKIDDNWHEVKEKLIKLVSINEVFKCKPHLLFYESKDQITINRLLRCILHSLSSCSTFIEWLDAVKTRREMIKGRYLYELIKIINGQHQSYQGDEMLCRWNDSRYNDAYILLKTILQDLEEEMASASGSDEQLPMKFRINTKMSRHGVEYTVCGDQLIFQLVAHSEDSVTIEEIFLEYFKKQILIEHSKCGSNNSKLYNYLLESLPKILCIHLNMFNEEDVEHNKKSNVIKVSETISIAPGDTSITCVGHKKYKLKTVIEHYGKSNSHEYACFKKRNNDWLLIINEDISESSLEEVLKCSPCITIYEVDDTYDVIDRGLITDKSCNDDALHSLPSLYSNKLISFKNIYFNLHFFNVLHCISTAPKLIQNLIDVSRSHSGSLKYLPSLEMLKTFNENRIESLQIYKDEILKSWAIKSYYDTLAVLTNVFSEILKSIDVPRNKADLFVRIFNFKFTTEDSSIIANVLAYPMDSSIETCQELWNKYFELLSNPSVKTKRIHFKKNDKTLEVLVSGNLPDTVGFYIPGYISNIIVSKPFILIMKNEFCHQNSKDEGSFGDCNNNGDCCKTYHLKSIIDKSNKCYVLCNDHLYLQTEFEPPMLQEDTKGIVLTFCLYE